MTWIIWAIAGAICYAVAEIISKYISDKKSEPVLIGIIQSCITTLVMFVFACTEQLRLPTDPKVYAGAIIAALLYAIGIITYYEGLKKSDISEFALISRSKILYLIFGGIFFFHDRFNIVQIIGGICVIYAVFLLTYEGGKIKFSKGMLFALATAFLFGTGLVIDKAIINQFTPFVYTFIDYILVVGFLLPLAFQRILDGVKLPHRKTAIALIVSGTFFGLSAYCIYSAFIANGPISLVSLTSQFEIVIAVLWGILILNERKRLWAKLFSMVILMFGILLLR